LFAAAEMGWDRVVQYLLDHGADPMITDINGQTALDAAIKPIRTGPAAAQEPLGSQREATVALLSTMVKPQVLEQ